MESIGGTESRDPHYNNRGSRTRHRRPYERRNQSGRGAGGHNYDQHTHNTSPFELHSRPLIQGRGRSHDGHYHSEMESIGQTEFGEPHDNSRGGKTRHRRPYEWRDRSDRGAGGHNYDQHTHNTSPFELHTPLIQGRGRSHDGHYHSEMESNGITEFGEPHDNSRGSKTRHRRPYERGCGRHNTPALEGGNNQTGKKNFWQRHDVIQLACESSGNILNQVQNEEEAFLNAFKFRRFLEDKLVLKNLIKILYLIINTTDDAAALPFVRISISRIITECEDFLSKLRALIQNQMMNYTSDSSSLNHVLSIAIFCVKHIASSTLKPFPHADLQNTFERSLKCSNVHVHVDQSMAKKYEEYNEEYMIKLDEMMKASYENVQSHDVPQFQISNYSSVGHHDTQPPDDFHECDILPKPDEISNSKYEPFLRTNLIESNYQNAEHYLDVQFRLLKEDFVGPLREGIESLNDARPDVTVYQKVRILEPVCLFSGIGFHIQFNPAASRMERAQWEHSRKLIYGSLLCLSNDNFKNILFASVVNRDSTELKSGVLTVKFEGENSHRSAFDTSPKQEYVMIESSAYYEAYRHVLEGLRQIIPDQMPFQPYIVGGCPSKIPPPLYLNQNAEFDFRNVLKFENDGSYRPRSIDMINYSSWPEASQTNLDESQLKALRTSLSQEISVIQGPPGTGKTFIGLKIVDALLQNSGRWNPNNDSPILVICYTNHALDQFLEGILQIRLDGGQHPNVVRIGGRCKSKKLEPFVMANIVKRFRKERRLSKGIAGHYTKVRINMDKNQADFEKIMGNLDIMEGKLLSFQELEEIIDKKHRRQFTEKAGRDMCIELWLKLIKNQSNAHWIGEEEKMNDEEDTIDENDKEFIDVIDEPQLLEEDRQEEGDEESDFAKKSLRKRQERKKIYKTKSRKPSIVQEDEWHVVEASEKVRKKRIAEGIKETPMTDKEVFEVNNVWKLTLKERWRLYLNWLNEFVMLSKTDLNEIAEEYNSSAKECMEVKEDINHATIAEAHIVGMTTTGAAKHNYLLKKLHPKIVIVEEAAEVMESHIITALCSSVQQLILIGDHKQLRPKPAYFKLEVQYDFNVSLFERLIRKKIPCVTLTTQHRMRPEIARIVGDHIYDRLDDAESVKKYKNVKGVEKNLFFIEHKEKEDSDGYSDNHSRSNTYEARYISNLTNYFLQQGYKPHQITILTMYRGQLMKIKQQMNIKTFGGVKVTAVDDFQGEENDIIIVSLVRSNAHKRIGFLEIENRICVALSRAKIGMFVIGNFSMLRDKYKTKWPAILQQMEKKGFLGNALPLCCQNHPQNKISANTPEDFSKSQAGGCEKLCSERLKCGHVCQSPCHPNDMEHEALYKCTKTCRKALNCKHFCSSRCCQCTLKGCGPCTTRVLKRLPCGHSLEIKCSTDPNKYKCTQSCDKKISDCGHKCTNKCSDECITSDKCTVKCSKRLNCSHNCQGSCGQCYKGRLHIRCMEKCDRILRCGHECKFPCTPNCPPCDEMCTNYCFHGGCSKKCYEPCVPCREPCKWECKHHKCTENCGEQCNKPPCNEPCLEIKQCGHPCIGLCGEDCPSLCRICDKDEMTEIFFGTEDEDDARFIQLIDCQHIFERSGLDHWMKQKNNEGVGFKECPKCKTPIRRSLRYGNIVKSALLKMEELKKENIKHIHKYDSEYLQKELQRLDKECVIDRSLHGLHQLIQFVQSTLADSKPHQLDTVWNQTIVIKKLLELMKYYLNSTTPARLPEYSHIHQDHLISDVHKIIQFMEEHFLTSQQVIDIQAETIRVRCLAQIFHFRVFVVYKGKQLNQMDDEELNALANLLAELGWKKAKANAQMQVHVDARIKKLKEIYEL